MSNFSKPIRVLLVDCDGTLHDNHARLLLQAKAAGAMLGLSAEQVIKGYFTAHDHIHQEFPERHDDVPFHFTLLTQALCVPLSEDQAKLVAIAWMDAYDTYQHNPIVYDDVEPFLRGCQALSLKLVLVSGSTDEERWALLHAMRLHAAFSRVFSANSVGFQKRDKRFFEHVIRELQIPADQLAIIGDDPEDDLLAARVGIRTIHLDRGQNQKPVIQPPDVTIHSLEEALPILRAWMSS